MLLSKLFSKCFISSESFEISLPTEVCIHIWSFLDFNTCQKICTCVSKKWLYEIRNSTRLSGEMILRLENQNVKVINNALYQWPKLKVLHLSVYNSHKLCPRHSKLVSLRERLKEFAVTTEILGMNLTEHALLRKIVVPKSLHLLELGDWGKATKVWFDPKNWSPPNLENVIALKTNVDFIPNNFDIEQIGQVLINVEDLDISGKRGMAGVKLDSKFILSFKTFILGFKKLTKVWIEVEVDIYDFLDFLHSIANVRDVQFRLNVCVVHDSLEEEYVKGVFVEGFKIVEKFQFLNFESTDIIIRDNQYDFKIDKELNKETQLYKYETDEEEFNENDGNFSD